MNDKKSAPFFLPDSKATQAVVLLSWCILNLLQSAFTELSDDEAYYWEYSNHLDYGYFDHPPTIALMIKAGYFLFQNELGVRLFSALLSTASVFILFRLAGGRNIILFTGILASMSIFETYGFVAVPDVPLLFFTAGFFLLYKRYLAKDDLLTVLLLGLTTALLLYSKYHGLLVIAFTIASNVSLFRRKSFYLVMVVATLLYIPHLVWQVQHDYPSYQYHILNKSQTPYNPEDTLNFVLGMLLIAGPFVGFFLYYAFFKHKVSGRFERSLKFTFLGFVVFFLLSTLNARVEPNWMLVAMVPLVIVAYPYILSHARMKKWVAGLSVFSCMLFLFFRANLMLDFFPAIGSNAMPEFFGSKDWAKTIRHASDGAPVVFCNSYQKAAKYAFYSKQPSMSLNNIRYRRNQYDFWNIEDSLQGKRILYIPNWNTGRGDQKNIVTNKEELYSVVIDNFRSYSKVFITTGSNSYKFRTGEQVNIPITLVNNYPQPVLFGQNAQYPDTLEYCLFREETFDHESSIRGLSGFRLDSTYTTSFPLKVPSAEGVYYLRIVIRSGWLPPLINSRLMRMVVEKG